MSVDLHAALVACPYPLRSLLLLPLSALGPLLTRDDSEHLLSPPQQLAMVSLVPSTALAHSCHRRRRRRRRRRNCLLCCSPCR